MDAAASAASGQRISVRTAAAAAALRLAPPLPLDAPDTLLRAYNDRAGAFVPPIQQPRPHPLPSLAAP